MKKYYQVEEMEKSGNGYPATGLFANKKQAIKAMHELQRENIKERNDYFHDNFRRDALEVSGYTVFRKYVATKEGEDQSELNDLALEDDERFGFVA